MSGLSDTFLVEEMITECVVELILGMTDDKQFGLSLTLGAGGIFTELLKDSVVLMMPLSKKHVKESISKLRANKLLNGWRGQPKGDSEELVETVMSFEKFIKNNIKNLAGCEINPLIVRPSGKGGISGCAHHDERKIMSDSPFVLNQVGPVLEITLSKGKANAISAEDSRKINRMWERFRERS